MQRKATAEKVLCLGLDGMDPYFTRRMLKKGMMPNVARLIERGACREDLVMLGGHPTVTPPMWTTLATGCYSNVHGITGFYRKSDTLDMIEYNLDSRLCKAELLWNCFAEAGKKTLVFHWPGSAWPPTSDSPNLLVVDGTAPGSVGMATQTVDTEFMVGGNVSNQRAVFKRAAVFEGAAACVVEDLDIEDVEVAQNAGLAEASNVGGKLKNIIIDKKQQGTQITEMPLDAVITYIKDADDKWANASAGAKECMMLFSGGLIRRPCLLLKNDQGVYDRIAIYKSKNDKEPLTVIKNGEYKRDIVDEAIKNDVKYVCNRDIKVINIEADGTKLSMWVSPAMDTQNDNVFHPKELHDELIENVGYLPPTSMIGGQDKHLITECMLQDWYHIADWEAAAIRYLIDAHNVEVVFSHFHAIDLQVHMFVKYLGGLPENRLQHKDYVKFMEDVYVQADYYIGQYMDLLDQGWAIFVFSDHALMSRWNDMPFINEISGVVTPVMEELGYTVLKCDESGKRMREIDWEKTRAVMQREGHIYINLKGRESTGIVAPEDKWELEEQIISDLYSYRDKKTNKRIIAVALHNKDAVLLGQGGPDAGDICCWTAEGYNFDHGDSLSTFIGTDDTSVSPIFIAAGPGIKKGHYTDRIIRQIDFTPTVAVVGGVRMPAQCEGAPVYQIMEEDY